MRDFTMLTYEDNCAKAKEMYLSNDEFHDYVEREAHQGQYTVEQLLGMAHIFVYMDCLLNRY